MTVVPMVAFACRINFKVNGNPCAIAFSIALTTWLRVLALWGGTL